jgi:acyl-CoA synthetase (NDP forming)
VNPRLGEVRGIKAYANIKDIPNQAELAIVAVRPSAVIQVLRECGESGIKAVLISSAGFADGDAESKNLGHRVVEIAREQGVRVIGPNTQGYMNLDAKLVILSVPSPSSPGDTGGIAFVSQSAFFHWNWIFRNPNLM